MVKRMHSEQASTLRRATSPEIRADEDDADDADDDDGGGECAAKEADNDTGDLAEPCDDQGGSTIADEDLLVELGAGAMGRVCTAPPPPPP